MIKDILNRINCTTYYYIVSYPNRINVIIQAILWLVCRLYLLTDGLEDLFTFNMNASNIVPTTLTQWETIIQNRTSTSGSESIRITATGYREINNFNKFWYMANNSEKAQYRLALLEAAKHDIATSTSRSMTKHTIRTISALSMTDFDGAAACYRKPFNNGGGMYADILSRTDNMVVIGGLNKKDLNLNDNRLFGNYIHRGRVNQHFISHLEAKIVRVKYDLATGTDTM